MASSSPTMYVNVLVPIVMIDNAASLMADIDLTRNYFAHSALWCDVTALEGNAEPRYTLREILGGFYPEKLGKRGYVVN